MSPRFGRNRPRGRIEWRATATPPTTDGNHASNNRSKVSARFALQPKHSSPSTAAPRIANSETDRHQEPEDHEIAVRRWAAAPTWTSLVSPDFQLPPAVVRVPISIRRL